VFFVLLFFWLVFLRPEQIRTATAIGHYTFFYMNNLPDKFLNQVQSDYIGDKSGVVVGTNDTSEDEEETPVVDTILPTNTDLEPEELLDKADQLLQKTNLILSEKEKNEVIPISKNKKNKSHPQISIIVTNLGLNRRSTELALSLPKQIALGFLPYTKSLKPLLNKAQNKGHEIYLYLPMQTSQSEDNPGRYSLMRNLPLEENEVRLNVILNSHAKYDGVYSNFKESFTADKKSSEAILDQLNDIGLIFVLGKNYENNLPRHIKSNNNIIATNIIIDLEPDKEIIKKELDKLIKIAKSEGTALGYAQGLILTIEMLRDWVPLLEKQGVKLVPISELLKERNL
jgi:polysaccharide deacetylase 2 family uncharacterized protein YibQ